MEKQPVVSVHGLPRSFSPTCSLCGGNSLTAVGQSGHTRKPHKRQKHRGGKCHRLQTDEAHWSKLLQTCHVQHNLSPPPVVQSPPLSPIAAIGQSVSRFFKRFNSPRKSSQRNSSEESDRPSSVSSEDSGVCSESPVAKSSDAAVHKVMKTKRLAVNDSVPQLQMPSSSTLLTKRLQDKQHRIQKPTPFLPVRDGKPLPRPLPFQGQARPLADSLSVPDPQSPNGGHLPLTVASSCPLEQKRTSVSESAHLSNTWPISHQHLTYDEEDDALAGEKVYMNDKRNVQEFTIPHENLQLDELIGTWKHGKVYRGRWHGDVMIQTYNGKDENASKEFWDEVLKMSKIRHENIALFMGACTSPDHLALITGICNGTSLYEKLHIVREKTTLTSKINLSYQIAQALAYLHAKKIVYKHMSSKNLFVEKQKAMLSVINFSDVHKSKDCAVDRLGGQLPYLAPECLNTISSSEPAYTTQSDVYAFGILLHELISGSRPFWNIPKDALVVQVMEGRRPCTDILPCPQTLKNLMEKCWSQQVQHRPHAHDILKELQRKDVALHSRFSSSEPDNINKLKSSYIL